MLSLPRLSRLVRVSRFLSTGTLSTEKSPVRVEMDLDLELDTFVDDIGLDVENSNKGLSFAKMLRQSKFMQLGDFNGRLVIGKIVHRMMDDLYIDVGLKFNTVVKVPPIDSDQYAIGATVLVRLHDYELSERFLGSKKDLTLLEADSTLIRLLRTATGNRPQRKEKKEITSNSLEDGNGRHN